MIQPGLPGTPAPPRPTRSDPAILRAAAATIVAELDQALPEDERMSLNDIADLVDWLAEEAAFETDGYRLARRLEECRSWSADAEIVETLHGIMDELDDLEEQAVLDWVIAYRITPPLPDGIRVTLTKPYPRIGGYITSPDMVFTIRRTNIERATYTLYSAALGHLSDEDMDNNIRSYTDQTLTYKTGSFGIIVPYERVAPVMP